MPVFRGVDQGREGPLAPPPEPPFIPPWEEVGAPRPPGGMAGAPEGAGFAPPILLPSPQQARVLAINRQPWGQLPAPQLLDPSRVSPRRFLAAAGRSLAGQLATLPAVQSMGVGPWLERMSEPPPGVVDGLMARSFAKMFVPSPEEMQEVLRTEMGAVGAIPPLAPAFRLPSNIGVGMSAAYGTTRQARRALAGAPGIPSRARLPIAGLKGVRGAAEAGFVERPDVARPAKIRLNTLADKKGMLTKADKVQLDDVAVLDPSGTRNYARWAAAEEWTDSAYKRRWQQISAYYEKEALRFEEQARRGGGGAGPAVQAGMGALPTEAAGAQLPANLAKALTPQETERLLLRLRREPYPNPKNIIESAAHDLEVHNLLLARKLPPNDPQWKTLVTGRGSFSNRNLRKGETWQSRNEKFVARTQLEAQVAREQMAGVPARPPAGPEPIVPEAAAARPPAPPPPPDVPDIPMPGDFYNWRPDPNTGQMPPPPPGLGQKVADAFSRGDPTLSMNLHRLYADKLEMLAEASSDPIVNKFLRAISKEHWDIGRDPKVITSVLGRQAAMRLTVSAQHNAALPLDEALARLGYDKRTGVIKGVRLKPGTRPAPPRVEGTFYDVRTRPDDYIIPEKLRLWLNEEEAINRNFFVVPEHQMGIKYPAKLDYAFASYRPRPGPEGTKARELFQRLKDAMGENPKLKLGRKQAFEYEKIFPDAPTAWENGFELVPEARTYMGNTLLRSRASARAIGDAVGEQVARELGGDPVVQSLRDLLGESANPILRAAEALHEATIMPILGLDPFGVTAIQLPAIITRELLRAPADISRGLVPFPVLRHTTASLFPSFMSRYPLHGLGWLKVAIPRMHRPESHMVFARQHADTIAYLNSLTSDPLSGITGYVDDVGISVPGKLRDLLRTPSKGQFATLGEGKVLTFEAMSRTMKKARATLSPDEMARFLDDAPIPPELVEKLKTSPSAFHDDYALATHLEYTFGGINAARTSPRAITRLLEKGLLAPGWTRKKIGLLLAVGKPGRQGELAREFLISSLTAYVLVGEPISYALAGEGMNLTHPDRSDWMAIKIGKGKWVNPMTPITSPLRAVVAPIYRRVQAGKWNFREPVSWGAGQLAPIPRMGMELSRDQTLYGNQAITTLSENSLKSRFFYTLRAEAPVGAQQYMDMKRTGTFGGVEAGLTAFSFNIVTPSRQQLLIREARVEAAIAAGVPTAQARELARYGANPIFAKDEDDKYILSDQARSAASASAFRYASRLDQAITQDVYDSSGWPTADNRRRQDERMRDFTDRSQKETDRHWTAVEGIGQQFEDTLAGKLTGDEALSPDAFRAALRSESEATRKARWQIDAERNTYVRENNLQQWWKQRQDDSLDHKQREDVARAAFLFGAEDVTGQQQPGILSIELYDHATGRTRYKERDALMAKWELLVGEDTVEEWLSSWRAAEAHPLVQEYWDGLDRYEYYFETRDRVLQKASPVARQWFDARDKASDTRNRLRQNLIRRAWPAEAKAAEDRMDAEKEYMRRTIPGLDAWLLKFGYRDKPVTEE